MAPVKFKVIVLDFDGTIVESVGIKDKAFQSLFADYPDHLEAIMTYHLAHNTTVRFDKFRYITENILKQEYSAVLEAMLSRRFSNLVFQRIVECPYVNGALEFLDYFSGILPLYLVSMTPHTELESILAARQLRGYFKDVYSAAWKKANALEDILRREGLKPEEAVYIGDAHEDFIVAQEKGIPFVGRDSGKFLGQEKFHVCRDMTGVGQLMGQWENA